VRIYELDKATYEDLQEREAKKVVLGLEYSSSAEALAIQQAFVMGSNTMPHRLSSLVSAMLAGRTWAKTELDGTPVELPHPGVSDMFWAEVPEDKRAAFSAFLVNGMSE